MRIDSTEENALNEALQGVNGDVWLFGSRVDDRRKGGDIDLLIFSEQNAYELSKRVSVRFAMTCDEKIDVVVMNPRHLTEEQCAFVNTIDKVQIR